MLRHVKRSVVERLGLLRVSEVADTAAARSAAVAARLERLERVVLSTDLLAAARVPTTSLISVVMPTRNRRESMLHAIESVRAQSYSHWELLVIDDGSSDGSADAADGIGDGRIRVLRSDARGAAAARNLGVRDARGEWVTFLDDDNTMAPHWLKAIARLAQEADPPAVVYGAQIRENERDATSTTGEAFMMFVEPFDFGQLVTGNFIDLGVLAVKASTPELWFDEELRRFIDWEMIVRLGATERLQAIPVWASVYFTDSPQRITFSTHGDRADAAVQFSRRLADPQDPMGRPGRRPPVPS